MTAKTIRRLVRHIDARSPYFLKTLGTGSSTEPERWRVALGNPEFVWALTGSYVEEGQALPDYLDRGIFHRVFQYMVRGPHSDPPLAMAEALHFCPKTDELVKALSICCSRGKIAELCHIALEPIELFEETFWNWRDRPEDKLFVARIFQSGKRKGKPRDQDLLYIAWKTRRVRAILPAGLWRESAESTPSLGELVSDFYTELQALASEEIARDPRGMHPKPALKLIRKLAMRISEEPPEQGGTISFHDATKLHFDHYRKLQAEREARQKQEEQENAGPAVANSANSA